MFEAIKKIIESKPVGDVLIQIVLGNSQEEQVYRGILGLLKSAKLENPKIRGQVIIVNENQDIVEILEENVKQSEDEEIRYNKNNKREVASIQEVEKKSKDKIEIPWKDNGVYLITGGLGGLGIIFAGEIGRKIKGAKIILTGRSKITDEKKAKIKELESIGLGVDYQRVDVSEKKDVESVIEHIKSKYGKLNGVIHSAGIIRDNFIIKKSREEYQEVIKPKVTGLVNIDECTREIDLDFMILFSSISGVTGNIGQIDYASANCFMDRYSEYRNELVKEKKRNGRIVSVDWPLWKEGGMKVDETTEKMMEENWGMIPLKTNNGIRA